MTRSPGGRADPPTAGALARQLDQDVYCLNAKERQRAPKSLADAVRQEEERKAAVAAKGKDAAAAQATTTAAK